MMIATSFLTAARAAGLSIALATGVALALPVAAQADGIASVDVVGTAFRITLASGRVLQGMELEGATLSLAMPGESTPRRVRLGRIVPDPMDPAHEVLLHRAVMLDSSGADVEACEPDPHGERWMFPVRGQWDADGRRVSDAGFTLTCSAGAQGKCVRFGYKPWTVLPDGTDLADYHRACVLLVRADYCGDHPTTRNGMAIDIYDRLGIQRRAESADDMSFKAAWGSEHALCVTHTRVPDNMTLDRLRQTCPWLLDRLGSVACTETEARSGRLGTALMFNRSR